MGDDALKREVSAAIRAQLREAWDYFADDDNMLPAATLGDLLSHLHYGDRTMQLGKGLHKTQVAVGTLPSDILFAAAALGMAPADAPGAKGAKRIAYPAFEKWCVGCTASAPRTDVEHAHSRARIRTHTRTPPLYARRVQVYEREDGRVG